MLTQRRKPRLLAGALGLGLGALAGAATLLLFSGGASARPQSGRAVPALDATHLPPLLTLPGEQVKLRYDVYCVGADDPTAGCDAGGIVYIRPGQSGPYRVVPLQRDQAAATGRLVASVPADIAASSSGFSYYAVLQDNASGATTTLPTSGAQAPQISLPMGDAVVNVNLGEHAFGATRQPDARLVSVAWGDGPARVGLEANGPEEAPIGASSFDVDAAGTVTVLDEAHRRALRWAPSLLGQIGRPPTAVPLALNGTLADLSVGQDGTLYVLESSDTASAGPVLRTFDAVGTLRSTVAITDRTASEVRVGADGPAVLESPSAQWVTVGGIGVQGGSGQSVSSARPSSDGSQVTVLRTGDELRVSVLSSAGRRSWRITSGTPLAEVQLAQALGKKLVVVVRVYSDSQDEFVALVLGANGVVRQYALAPNDWAETAPVSKFRLVGSSLYQLGSNTDGAFVDRFELG